MSSEQSSHVDPPESEARTNVKSRKVRVNPDTLSEFNCPICLDVMCSVVVTWCLHRFCKECIEKHLRLVGNNRDCPSCRVHIKSKRDLRKDERMDALIRVIFGEIKRSPEKITSSKRYRSDSDSDDSD